MHVHQSPLPSPRPASKRVVGRARTVQKFGSFLVPCVLQVAVDFIKMVGPEGRMTMDRGGPGEDQTGLGSSTLHNLVAKITKIFHQAARILFLSFAHNWKITLCVHLWGHGSVPRAPIIGGFGPAQCSQKVHTGQMFPQRSAFGGLFSNVHWMCCGDSAEHGDHVDGHGNQTVDFLSFSLGHFCSCMCSRLVSVSNIVPSHSSAVPSPGESTLIPTARLVPAAAALYMSPC